jgi:sporulation protein YlmC with PRC-barrel domain
LASAKGVAERTQVQVSQPSADVQVQQPAPQVAVQQPAPEVTVQQPQPKVTVTQPAPKVTVEQPQPKVTVEQTEPKVTVTQAKPNVTVQQPDPKVTVNQAKPDVKVQQAEPEVTVQQKVEPAVKVEQSQAEVKPEPAQPSAMSADKSAEAPSPAMADAEKPIAPVEVGKDGSEMGSQTAATEDKPAATTGDQVTGSIDRTPNPVVDMGRGMVGRSIYGSAGDEIGNVDEVVMAPDGRVGSALVHVGGFLGFGGKQVAIDVSTLQLQGERLVTNMTEEQVKELPAHTK